MGVDSAYPLDIVKSAWMVDEKLHLSKAKLRASGAELINMVCYSMFIQNHEKWLSV